MIVLAHISDPHFDGGERSAERSERVMRYLNGLPRPVDAVIVTDRGRPKEYEQARTVLRSERPIYFGPGNHDDREQFRAALTGGDGGADPINSTCRVGDVVVILCDSTIRGHQEGLLTEATLDFLRNTLVDTPPDTSVLIGLHHPPTRIYSPIVDPIRLQQPEALAEIVAGDDRILAVVCGHAHTSAVTTFAGKPLAIAPSISSVLGPDWEGGGMIGGSPVVDYDAQPSIAIHVIDDDRRLTTHFRAIA